MSETARRALRLTLAGALALAAAVAVSRYIMLSLQTSVHPVRVLVAQAPIQPYATIAAGQVQTTYLPSAALPGPALSDPSELAGQRARVAILPDMAILRAYLAPASELRYTEDPTGVIVPLTVRRDRTPASLLASGQRIDVWQGDNLIGESLRVVALEGLPDGDLLLAIEASQELTAGLLAAAGRADLAVTLAPLARRSTATATSLPTPARTPVSTCSASSPLPAPSPSATPVVAVVRPGPAQGLNVRAGPGTGYLVLDVLPAGRRLTVAGRSTDGKWVEVCCVRGGARGWVAAELVDLPAPIDASPSR